MSDELPTIHLLKNPTQCEMTEESMRVSFHRTYERAAVFVPPAILSECLQLPPLDRLMLTWGGCYQRAYGHRLTPRVFESEWGLLYCVEGQGELHSGGATHAIRPGDLLFLFPGAVHAYHALEHDPWSCYWFNFMGSSCDALMQMLAVTPEQPVVHTGFCPTITADCAELLECLRSGFSMPQLMLASAHLQTILYRLLCLKSQTPAAADEPLVAQVVELLGTRIYSTVTLDELAAHCRCTKYYLLRHFKAQTGFTPIDYLAHLKLERACALLLDGSYSVRTISEMLGYSSPYYFSSCFKKKLRLSPSAYRKGAG